MWRAVAGYEGFYEVSNSGLVRSIDRTVMNSIGRWVSRKGRTLTFGWHPGGYPQVNLCRAGVCKTHFVHRLVALAFLPNPLDLPEVNHKSFVKTDNCVGNLEWASKPDNLAHAVAGGRYSAITNPNFSQKLTVANVDAIRSAAAAGERQARLAEQHGVCAATVSEIVAGKSWRLPVNSLSK